MAKTKSGPSHEWDNIGIGDQVKHSKWGEGTVLFRSGSGENAKAIVVFPEEGQKKLLLEHAKLKKIGGAAKSAQRSKTLAKQASSKPAKKSASGGSTKSAVGAKDKAK